MIYKIFWFWANIAIRVFYGKIEVSGLENVPKDGPLLIASNHPNGFLEPIIMACLFPRDLHFMVRGDVFRKKWLNPILVNTNQIPIFRAKDGFAELRKNDQNLREAYKALDKDAAIILFIEGGTKSIKKLRPFQKGLARMASSYLEQNPTADLNVLPVAINFISPKQLRSRVMLNIGHAFKARDYIKDSSNKVQEIRKLTDDVYDLVSPLAFNVDKANRQPLLNKMLRVAEGLFKQPFFPIVSRKHKMWNTMKSVSEVINNLSDVEVENLENEMKSFSDLDAYHVKRTGKNQFISILWTIVSFVPAMIGLLLNIIPGLFSLSLAKKVLKPSNQVFRASIILSSGVGFYVVYYALVILILSLFFGWKSFLFLLAWPLGFVYLFWKYNYRSAFARNKYHLSKEEISKAKSIFDQYNITLENTIL